MKAVNVLRRIDGANDCVGFCDRRNDVDLRRLRKLETDIDRAKSDLRWAERQLAEFGSAEAILP